MARHLPKEIRVPFQVGPHGGIDFTTDPVLRAIQHIMSAVATNPGERVMRPEYGAPVWDLLFAADDPLTGTAVVDDMRRSLAIHEPGITILSITLNNSRSDDAMLQFFITFRLAGFEETHEASIEVGGTVTERTLPR